MKKLLTALLLLLLASPCYGAVTFDAVGGPVASSSPFDSLSWTHVNTASGNTLFLGCVHISEPLTVTVTSFTYGGQSLTNLIAHNDAGSHARIEVWYLKNPPSGSNTASVSLSSVPGNGSIGGSLTFSGVDQTTPFGTSGTADSAATTNSVTVTNAANGLVANCITVNPGTTDPVLTAGGAQTQQYNLFNSTNAISAGAGTNSATGAVTPSWSWTGNQNSTMMAVPINPATVTVGGKMRSIIRMD